MKSMRLVYFYLLLVLIGVLSACNTNDPKNPGEQTVAKMRLDSIISSSERHYFSYEGNVQTESVFSVYNGEVFPSSRFVRYHDDAVGQDTLTISYDYTSERGYYLNEITREVYDKSGNKVSLVTENVEFGYTDMWQYVYEGGEMTKETQSIDGRGYKEFVYQYDEQGHLIKKALYNLAAGNKLVSYDAYAYDSLGRQSMRDTYHADGQLLSRVTILYGENGMDMDELHLEASGPEKQLVLMGVLEDLYNVQGQLVSRSVYRDMDKKLFLSRVEWEYTDFGAISRRTETTNGSLRISVSWDYYYSMAGAGEASASL